MAFLDTAGLGEKVGGRPAWQWALMGGVGIAVLAFIRRPKTTTAGAPVMLNPALSLGGGGGGGGSTDSPPPPTPPPPPPGATSCAPCADGKVYPVSPQIAAVGPAAVTAYCRAVCLPRVTSCPPGQRIQQHYCTGVGGQETAFSFVCAPGSAPLFVDDCAGHTAASFAPLHTSSVHPQQTTSIGR